MKPYDVIVKLDVIWQQLGETLARFPIPIEVDPLERDRAARMIPLRTLAEEQEGLLPEKIIRAVSSVTLMYQATTELFREAAAAGRRNDAPGWHWRAHAILVFLKQMSDTLAYMARLMDEA